MLAGGPRSAKTTRAKRWGILSECPVFHTDDAMGLGWSECSAEVATWFDRRGPWIIEGIAAVRALRKWLRTRRPAPCDLVVWMDTPVVVLTTGQESTFKGCRTVWAEIVPELVDRGVVAMSYLGAQRVRG